MGGSVLAGWLQAQRIAERGLASIGIAVLFSIMATVTADVVMRYAVGRPIGWAYDVISLYLMPALFYVILPYSYAVRAHIGVDIVQQRFSWLGRRAAHILIGLVSAAFFCELGRLGADRAYEDYTGGATQVGEYAWQTWLSAAFIPVGCALIASRLLLEAVAHTMPMFGLSDPIGLPGEPDPATIRGE